MVARIIFVLALIKLGSCLECYTCQSNVDPSCAQLGIGVSQWGKKNCSDSCASWIEDTVTVRGCTADGEQPESCTTDLCNGGVYPEDRVQCMQGNGTENQPCVNYDIFGRCFINVESATTVHRGCTSDADFDKLCPTKSFCEIGSTNDKPIYQNSNMECVVCTQTLDNNCFNKTESENCPPLLLGRRDRCFTKQTDHSLERGCQIITDPCATPSCQSCTGKGCNNKLKSLLQCYKHKDNEDPKLQFLVANEGVALKCYRNVTGGDRGFWNELEQTDKDSCDSGDNGCKVCNFDKCNEKNSFQSCYDCESSKGVGCVTIDEVKTPKKACKDYLATCSIKRQEAEIIRGCKEPEDVCGQDCEQCLAPNCNNYTYPRDRLSCHQCEGENCVNVTSLSKKVCEKYVSGDQCYTYVENRTSVFRGCQSDESFKTHCDGKPFCQIGVTNDQAIVEPKVKCVVCNQNKDEKCHVANKTSECSSEVLLGRPKEECYTESTDNSLERGCLLSKTGECNAPSCTKCSGDGCNNNIFFASKCISCSSDDDPNCKAKPSNASSINCISKEKQISCYLSENGGNTERGCVSKLNSTQQAACEANSDTCKVCNSPDCNLKPSFQKCLKCNAKENPNCNQLEEEVPGTLCRGYPDNCFETLDTDKKAVRGCESEKSEPCTSGCNKCTEENCNKNPAQKAASLKCIKCSADEPACGWGFDPNSAKSCENIVELGTFESCYSRHLANGSVERGCANDVACEGNECKKCLAEGCNFENINSQSCVVCSSDSDKSCENENSSDFKKCASEVQPYDTRGCYTARQKNNNVVRGCIVDQPTEIANYCKEYPKKCEICVDQQCNNLKAPNSGAMVNYSQALIILGVIYYLTKALH